MRYICFLLFFLLLIVSPLLSAAASEASTNRHSAGQWRRTVSGWERINDWPQSARFPSSLRRAVDPSAENLPWSPLGSLHPLWIGCGQLLVSLAAMRLLSGRQKQTA